MVFIEKNKKFTNCENYKNITASVECKVDIISIIYQHTLTIFFFLNFQQVDDLNSVKLSRSGISRGSEGRKLVGRDCDYLKMSSILDITGCTSGQIYATTCRTNIFRCSFSAFKIRPYQIKDQSNRSQRTSQLICILKLFEPLST